MAQLDAFETAIRHAGGVVMLTTLVALLVGLVRGSRRPAGRVTGAARKILRLRTYLVIGLPYLGVCIFLWRPLGFVLSPLARAMVLILGPLFYFPGIALVVWGRLTLGEMYNASSGFGVELFANHRLITGGPYAHVRHPMYLGLLLAALGGLALYRTWTLVFLLMNALAVIATRAKREEQALAVEFGVVWQEYCQRVPFLIPRA